MILWFSIKETIEVEGRGRRTVRLKELPCHRPQLIYSGQSRESGVPCVIIYYYLLFTLNNKIMSLLYMQIYRLKERLLELFLGYIFYPV